MGDEDLKSEIIDWIKSIVIALLFVLIITTFIGSTSIYGNSMYPTLYHGDFLITYKKGDIGRGDIVIFQTNMEIDDEELSEMNLITRWKAGKYKKLIKRVIAMEGDSLVIRDGKVIVNGQVLDEDYVNGNETLGDVSIEKIPRNKVFVMGDNRGNSLDSRNSEIGLVDIEDVRGETVIRIFPFSRISILNK